MEEQPEATTLKLTGRVAGPWLRELSEVWQRLLPSLPRRALVVDLQDVTFADAEGARLLRAIYRKSGCQFLANTPMTRHLAEQTINEAQG